MPHRAKRIRGATSLAIAGAMTVAGWVSPAPGRADPPETVAREVFIDLGGIAPLGPVAGAAAVTTLPHVACSPIEFDAVALAWRQSAPDAVTARLAVSTGPDATFGPDTELVDDPEDGPAPGSPDYNPGVRATPPLWTGGGRCVRFSMSLPGGASAFDELRAVFVNTSGTAFGGPPSTYIPGAADVAPAGIASAEARPGQPLFVTRAGWGANESLKNCQPDVADRLKMSFVHHTASGNDYRKDEADDVIRAIYYYHTKTRGYCDIAYNFLVDRFGRPFVGRTGGITRPVVSAATQGFNTGSVSVSAVGNFQTAGVPAAVLAAFERVLAWRLDVAHIPPNGIAYMTSGGGEATKYREGTQVKLPVIAGHRHTGLTSCPGDNLFAKLPTIRAVTHALGAPKFFRPAQSAAAIKAGSDSVTYSAFSTWDLRWRLDLKAGSTIVRSFAASGKTFRVAWDGTDGSGKPVAEGQHVAAITATDAQGRIATPAIFRIQVG